MGLKGLIIAEGNTKPVLSLTDVLGASLAERSAQAMLGSGVAEVWIVSTQGEPANVEWRTARVHFKKAAPGKLWEEAEDVFCAMAADDVVLMARMNSYSEVDWKRFSQRHRSNGACITRAWANATTPLDIYAVDARSGKDAGFLFRAHLGHSRLETGRYELREEEEYSHPLTSARDLRDIARASLELVTRMRPVGREVKPGIWMADKARVDQGVRLVAPAYIGRYSRVRTGAVITRGSTVEHHARIDCGTVVEDASILPFTVVGAGLDVCRAVVAGKRLMDLRRNIEMEISDSTLVGESAHNAGVRVLAKAASLASYVPLQFWRGVTQRNPIPAVAGEAVCTPELAGTVIKETVVKDVIKEKTAAPARSLRPELVMERYGNQ